MKMTVYEKFRSASTEVLEAVIRVIEGRDRMRPHEGKKLRWAKEELARRKLELKP